MPRREGTFIISVSATGASRKMEHQLNVGQRRVHTMLQSAVEQIGYDVQFFLQGHAPSRTEHLKLSIDTFLRRSVRRPTAIILIDVRDPDHPYDYVNVTRFGRKAVVAKRPSLPSKALGERPIMFGRTFKRRSAASLRFEPGAPGSGFIYRRRVAAWRPSGDWVARAAPAIDTFVNEAMEETAEEIQKAIAGRKGVTFSGSRRVFTKVLR